MSVDEGSRYRLFERLQRILATVRAEMNTQARTMIHAMIFSTSAAVVTVGALAVGAARVL